MDVTVTNAKDQKRYEARVDGVLAAVADYIPTDELVAFTHTQVMAGFEGKGLGSTVVRHGLDDVRRQQLAALAVCPFVTAYVQRHPEYRDLLYQSRTGAVAD